MKKYYYFYWVANKQFGCGVRESRDSGFDVYNATIQLRERVNHTATISFWSEISSDDYDRMRKMLNEGANN